MLKVSESGPSMKCIEALSRTEEDFTLGAIILSLLVFLLSYCWEYLPITYTTPSSIFALVGEVFSYKTLFGSWTPAFCVSKIICGTTRTSPKIKQWLNELLN